MDAVVNKNLNKPKPSEKFIGRQIGSKLRRLYSEILAEPVPERFHMLIEQLAQATEHTDRVRADVGSEGEGQARRTEKSSSKI